MYVDKDADVGKKRYGNLECHNNKSTISRCITRTANVTYLPQFLVSFPTLPGPLGMLHNGHVYRHV